ncbi:cellulase family glycosylhydrolase [Piscirickettsia litoralis]|uniref:Glycoside hydrolase family 5 domain-containing protein n=1 Tax=Piscirickettsia litoralis TaxID=1891921 RepID=A0ABX3A633_9GAMM|nr:cellulase family glycosylhydrolase [Piscirickettsia litoralis]ODN42935.1 hypothetical protein BGC07_08385 [Piscirickettsia litoralis]
MSLYRKLSCFCAASLTLTLSVTGFSATVNTFPFGGINISAAETGSGAQSTLQYLNRIDYPNNAKNLSDCFNNPTQCTNYFGNFPAGTSKNDSFSGIGMNIVRLPFRWDYVFNQIPTSTKINELGTDTVNSNYLKPLAKNISNLLNTGAIVILDAHDYMQWNPNAGAGGGSFGKIVTEDEISHIWGALVNELKAQGVDTANNHLWFEISNEPNHMSASSAYNLDVAGLKSIRSQGLKNKIIVEGTYYSGMWSWFKDEGQGVNSDAFKGLLAADKEKNVAVAMHQYFDSDYSGTQANCVDTTSSVLDQSFFNKLDDWMKENKIDVILDEFGVPGDKDQVSDVCAKDVNSVLNYMHENTVSYSDKLLTNSSGGHFLGWTVWNYSPVYKNQIEDLTPGSKAIDDIYKKHLPTV